MPCETGQRVLATWLGRCAVLLVLATSACAARPPEPAALAPGQDTCRHCRMVVSDPRLAAQLVAPGEEPAFFDDLGCLRDYLAAAPALPDRAAIFVADHRDGAWVPAPQAVYARVAALETPMGSHLLAHADVASRAADPTAAGGVPVAAAEILGETAAGGPDGEAGGTP
jgi:copper chaperone NosL